MLKIECSFDVAEMSWLKFLYGILPSVERQPKNVRKFVARCSYVLIGTVACVQRSMAH